jgi:ribonucleoside-triphosphate reductase class III activase subunit (EC 1.17.4.2)
VNYHQYLPVDVVNGPGTRCTLFVSGCEHQCRGCYNKATWPLNSGHPFTDLMQEQIVQDLLDSRIPRRGLSLSGGDPLHPANIESVKELLQEVVSRAPSKDIWLWTGYTLAELSSKQRDVVDLVDVLIDGKFIQDEADPHLVWRGSANQCVHFLSERARKGQENHG